MNEDRELKELYDIFIRNNEKSGDAYLNFIDAVYETFPDWTEQEAYDNTRYLF